MLLLLLSSKSDEGLFGLAAAFFVPAKDLGVGDFGQQLDSFKLFINFFFNRKRKKKKTSFYLLFYL
jgi:hypothetical protein